MTWWQFLIMVFATSFTGFVGLGFALAVLLKLKKEIASLEERQAAMLEEIGDLHRRATGAIAEYQKLETLIRDLERDGVVIYPATGQRIINWRGKR